ncbi:trehalose-phosphatase [Pyricularia oryzae Y34]|uniref:Trehalose-phosphatase n=1 Tax=Pyricularia oryzae (strain Y34) TaxID=1143189 RepID=A0AA97PN06_PYRO3|nr:trehalose-phosphatase [Pyricularia oryzae Y34]
MQCSACIPTTHCSGANLRGITSITGMLPLRFICQSYGFRSIERHSTVACNAVPVPSHQQETGSENLLAWITLEPQGSAYPWDQNQGSEGVASCSSALRRRQQREQKFLRTVEAVNGRSPPQPHLAQGRANRIPAILTSSPLRELLLLLPSLERWEVLSIKQLLFNPHWCCQPVLDSLPTMSQDAASAPSDLGAQTQQPHQAGNGGTNSSHGTDNIAKRALKLGTSTSLSPELPPTGLQEEVPVTPGITTAAYHDFEFDNGESGGGPGYFSRRGQNMMTTPVGKGVEDDGLGPSASSSAPDPEVLKRINQFRLGGRKESLTNIRAMNPDLSLSGNIISATFNIPYSLEYRKGADWVLNPRRGQSALFDSLSHLSSDNTPWNHTVVAWTGEIEPPSDLPSPPATPPATTTNLPALNSLSKPIPVNGEAPAPAPSHAEGLWIPREDQLRLESQLSHNAKIKTSAVWLSDSNEATEEGITLKDQARWRREFFRCLPRRKEVLEGVLGSNMIGFQSYSYSRHFSSCCTRILGYKSDARGVNVYGSRVEVGVFPIGIDAKKVEQLAWSDSVNKLVQQLQTQTTQGRKLIVGRDRLDSVHGVAQKLKAFERFLENYPEWRDKVVLIQVTSPTSIEEEKDESKVSTLVNELVLKINGMYGGLGFEPVRHFSQYIGQDEYFALLRGADIGLITSVRDGMNTTSMEYVVCQRDSHGPLILSEFSGTAGSLTDAIHINPWDFSAVADEINRALTMPPHKRQEMQTKLYEHVTTKTVHEWIGGVVAKLIQVLGSGQNPVKTPLLDRSALLRSYRAAGKRLFMFDYDGTLTPIVREPSAAVPTERLLQTIKALAADDRNAVWVISGRDQDFLSAHLGHIQNLGFSAEHGSFMKKPGSDEWENLADKFDMGWQEEVIAVFQKFTDKVEGPFIERKRCAVTWHYRPVVDQDLAQRLARECHKELEATVARKWEVEVMPGKMNLEVRPTFINKGAIAKRLVLDYNAELVAAGKNKLEFVLCMGDDFTDEDMFRSLNTLSVTADGATEPELKTEHVFSTTVGPSTKVTIARWHLLEPEDVVECVALLASGVSTELLANQGEGVAETVKPLRVSENNLAAISEVEGRVPDIE